MTLPHTLKVGEGKPIRRVNISAGAEGVLAFCRKFAGPEAQAMAREEGDLRDDLRKLDRSLRRLLADIDDCNP